MLVVAPGAGVKVPAAALNVPPVPDVRVQVPPKSSPMIRLNKSIDVLLESQTVVLPSEPAFGWLTIFTVAILTSSGHGAVPATV